ncbi:MAG TPA: phage holin family protein, partial [Candidatus Limnocylindrales bacterium]|nr:phage holin family protein [Candidatus Limnocylindrales bacterium]
MDGNGSTPAGAPATGAPPSSAPSSEPPGIRAQIGATIEAGKRLVRAHIELAKAELGEIMGAVGRMVGLFAAAFVLVLFAATLLAIGGLMFLGEWLFGSIGWGVLLGVLLFLDIAVTAVLLALDVSARRVGTSVGIAVVVGVVVGIVMAFDLTHRGWTAVGDSVAAAYDPNT